MKPQGKATLAIIEKKMFNDRTKLFITQGMFSTNVERECNTTEILGKRTFIRLSELVAEGRDEEKFASLHSFGQCPDSPYSLG